MRLNGNKDQKLPQIPHPAKSCILLGKISMFCVKRIVLDSCMQNFSSRCDFSTDLWKITGVIS